MKLAHSCFLFAENQKEAQAEANTSTRKGDKDKLTGNAFDCKITPVKAPVHDAARMDDLGLETKSYQQNCRPWIPSQQFIFWNVLKPKTNAASFLAVTREAGNQFHEGLASHDTPLQIP